MTDTEHCTTSGSNEEFVSIHVLVANALNELSCQTGPAFLIFFSVIAIAQLC